MIQMIESLTEFAGLGTHEVASNDLKIQGEALVAVSGNDINTILESLGENVPEVRRWPRGRSL